MLFTLKCGSKYEKYKMFLTFLIVLIALTDHTSVSNARNIPPIPTKENSGVLETLLSIDNDLPSDTDSHFRSKRDLLDTFINIFASIPGVPKLPYRQMIEMLNPLRIKFGGDLKGNVNVDNGNLVATGVVGARMGMLGVMTGIALGTKGSIGKDGVGLSYGGTLGYGQKSLPDGALANGDTNVPYAQYNSNNITA